PDPSAPRNSIAPHGEQHGNARLPVASALAFKAYTWTLIEVAVGRWVTERRVVDVSPHRVCVQVGRDGEPTLEFLSLHYTVLPDDPMAGESGVDVVATERELLDVLRRTLVENHLAPAVEAFRALRGGG